MSTGQRSDSRVRTFVLVSTPAALAAWQVGFELDAFEVIAYRRVFAVFVVSTVALIVTFLAPDSGFATTLWSRLILSLPLVYIAADIMLLTESTIVTAPLSAAILLTSPYIVWVAARWMGSSSSRWRDANRWAPIILVVTIGALGWYVDHNKNHFFTCRDFVHMVDFKPSNCVD